MRSRVDDGARKAVIGSHHHDSGTIARIIDSSRSSGAAKRFFSKEKSLSPSENRASRSCFLGQRSRKPDCSIKRFHFPSMNLIRRAAAKAYPHMRRGPDEDQHAGRRSKCARIGRDCKATQRTIVSEKNQPQGRSKQKYICRCVRDNDICPPSAAIRSDRIRRLRRLRGIFDDARAYCKVLKHRSCRPRSLSYAGACGRD